MTTGPNIINFGGGPAKLPKEVLNEIQSDIINYQNTGFSITELSHRGPHYIEINKRAQNTLRELLDIPENYKILFMPGGGQGAFSAIPMNLIGKSGSADYLVTGFWSKLAAEEAKKYGDINVITETDVCKNGITQNLTKWNLNPKASYLFYCSNDPVDGVEFPFIPESNNVPIVTDMCSNILTKQMDISKFGLIFAAAQKNIGTAGVTLIIVREDLLGNPLKYCPNTVNFTLLDKYDSILNTPPVFSIYVMGKIFQWVKVNGGVSKMELLVEQKSQLVYSTIDYSNGFYYSLTNKSVRSRITIPFRIGGQKGDEALEKIFLEEANQENMVQLKGGSLMSGIRVCLFNSITVDEVQKLVEFMLKFQKKYNN